MKPFAMALVMVAAVCLSVAGLHLAVGLRKYRSKVHLLFALLALAAFADAFLAPWKYSAETIEAFASLNKWSIHFQAAFALALAWFLWAYAGIRNRMAPLAFSGIWLLHEIFHTLLPFGIHYESVTGLRTVSLPWGETFRVAEGAQGQWLWVGDLLGIGIMAYAAGFAAYLWRSGERRRAAVLSIGLAPLVLVGIPQIVFLLDRGNSDLPSLYTFAFLSLVLMMSSELVGDVVRSSKLAKEIRGGERRWRSVLENANLLIAGCDRSGHVNYVNPFYLKATGFEPGGLLGRHYLELVGASEKQRIRSMAAQIEVGDGIPLTRTEVRTKSGPPRIVGWSTVFLRDTDGAISGALSIGADVTEQAQAEADRDRSLHELKELKSKLEEENLYLRGELELEDGEFSEIIGQSDAIKYVLHMIRKVAPTDATVLIEGETGVGKELVARALHEKSARVGRPFVRVNCGVLPAELVAAELFGHEKGAFTGADRQRKGRFELADGGTLFLDEVGELPLEVQTKLLRVLQEGEFERLGSSETLRADVRLIAATNRNLQDEVATGRFREDLFYRLHVFPITVPPLRDRREDVPLLVQHFVGELGSQHRRSFDEVPGSVMRELTEYDWPGNVRELVNVLERALITSPEGKLRLGQALVARATEDPPAPGARFLSLEEHERQYLRRVLETTAWRVAGPGAAAEILQMNASTLRSRMKKYGLDRPSSVQ